MEYNNPSLFAAAALESAADLALALTPHANTGHFDELRGATSTRPNAAEPVAGSAAPAALTGPLGLAGQAQSQRTGTGAGQSQTQGASPSQSQSQSQSQTTASPAAEAALAPAWKAFFTQLGADGFGELNQRNANLQRLIRDNGVTYNVYADEEGPQRPWSLDLFPLIVDAPSWANIEAGVLQRVRLLEAVLADPRLDHTALTLQNSGGRRS